MKFFELFLSFCVLASVGKAVKYQATFGEEILPCDSNWPTLNTIIDYTQLNITKLMSGVLLLNGNVTIIQDFDKNVAFEVQITFKKKEQGKYVLTPFRKIIPNFCLVEFNPQEIWYSTTRKFKGDARQCPPRKGVRSVVIFESKTNGRDRLH